MRIAADAPVVAVDIDGTLGDYYEHFRKFAELYTQRKITAQWQLGMRGEFSEALGLDKNLYRQIKLAYRQGGMKRSLPAFNGAGSAVRKLRSKGYAVWICTTRPWNRLDNVDPDTQFWIENVCGRVDGITYGEDKYSDLIDLVGDRRRIVGVVDDLPENVLRAKALGLNALLMAGPHNSWWRVADSHTQSGIPVTDDIRNLPGFVEDWERNHEAEEAAMAESLQAVQVAGAIPEGWVNIGQHDVWMSPAGVSVSVNGVVYSNREMADEPPETIRGSSGPKTPF